MSRELFGTDGIRGPSGAYPLNDTGMLQIGKAVGAYFTEPGDMIVVGWDPRESSEGLVSSLVEGLVSMGVNVHKAGVIPTPGLAYVTRQSQAKAAVMITASHNPYTDNGVKVFSGKGTKLPDGTEAELNRLIAGEIPARGTLGAISDDVEAIEAYERFLATSAGNVSFDGWHLGIDTANGAASGIASRVFSELGTQITSLFDRPDGRNINAGCGATDTAALQKAVLEQKLDGGIALDGDGDRVIIIDEKGRELTGDHLLYILAVATKQTGVVATIMSNQGLETALKDCGISLHRTAVGDRYVLEGLEQTGFRLGGEQSGHIILPEYATTGDGLLAAIRVLSFVKTSGRSLSDWHDELTLLPQALVSIPFNNKELLEHPEVKALIDAETAALGDAGRLNIRPSGTEPKIRIMVEAPDAAKRARSITDKLIELTRKLD